MADNASGVEPRVWVIDAYRAGEHSQLLALAEALGWPFEVKKVSLRWQGALLDLMRATGNYGIDSARSSVLQPPWPDLVLAAGMRNEPLCRWIREQSGGRTRLVHVGRPWARPHNFDLIVTTPQYRLADHPRILQNTLTLHRVTPLRLKEAVDLHGERLLRLPQPRIAVVVGGPAGPYAFGRHAAGRLARQASQLARQFGGSLMITGSKRTPRKAFELLCSGVDVPHEAYFWRSADPANPYYAYLALADRVIVSFDSIAMLSEACATGRPVYMFDIHHDRAPGADTAPMDHSPKSIAYTLLMHIGPQRLSRDVGLVHELLLREGRAQWLGRNFDGTPPRISPDMERAVSRVRELFGR